MSRARYSHRPFYDIPTAPFQNAEEAWFWFIRCQKARADGARFEADMGSMARPCDPDDLYRAVIHLARQRRLSPEHLQTLDTFGLALRPPDPRCREEERPARLWDEALERLSILLKTKGIIE
ncbi:MAG: hypothetical protein HQ494_06445 [Rhodospirillales bacterium]|nr:hypothetical protein [Rhodospirillales bacterium]